MKQSVTSAIVIFTAIALGYAIWWFVLGNPDNFADGTNREKPENLLGIVFLGKWYAVPLLIACSIIVISIAFERFFSLNKAKGRGSLVVFLKNVQQRLSNGDIEGALKECDRQRGSLASILHAGLTAYQSYVGETSNPGNEKRMTEVQRAIEEATALEMPILERNLIILSTVASISTMLGLFGTTTGMIIAFRALARAGAPDAIQLSIGISEALVNTAFGLIGAILGIVFYNFFTNRVDNFTYMIDEASYDIIQTLNTRSK